MTGTIGMLIIGLVAGWLAKQLSSSGRPGIIGMTFMGLIGSFVGGFLFSLVGFEANGMIAQLIVATCGALVAVWALRKWVQ